MDLLWVIPLQQVHFSFSLYAASIAAVDSTGGLRNFYGCDWIHL